MTAYSPTEYAGDGITTDYTFSWDYIDEDHVRCYINSAETEAFTMPSAGMIRFDTAPSSGATIEIRRVTPAYPLLVTWNDGAMILGSDLNKATKQAIYSAEETAAGGRALVLQWLGAWSGSSVDYAINDGVTNDGSSYICISSHTSSASTEPGVGASWSTYWDTLAEKGNTGPSGPGTGDMVAATYDPAAINEQLVGLAAVQTMTNKTLTTPTITDPIFNAGSVDAITEIDSAIRSGDGTKVATVTTATDTHVAKFDSAGKLVPHGAAPSGTIVGTTDTQTLSGKTLSSPVVTVGSDATGDIYYRTSGGVFQRLGIGSDGQHLGVSASGVPVWEYTGMVPLGVTDAASASQVDLTGLSSSYAAYIISFKDVQVDTDGTVMAFRYSTDGGSSFEAGASSYAWSVTGGGTATTGGTALAEGNRSDGKILLNPSITNTKLSSTGGRELTGYVMVINPMVAASVLSIIWNATFTSSTNYITNVVGGGKSTANANVNAVRFYPSSGGFTQGIFQVHGLLAST